MTLVEGSRAILGGRFALPGTPLEAGGHARLYKAYDLELDRPAAVKVFTPAQPVDPRTLRLAWSNELDAYTRLGSHRNLLTLLAYDAPEGYDQWIAFEWCGEDLQKFILRAPATWDTFRPISYEILAGLSALHSRGYVHRDLKPKNVLIADGAVKLADFGTIRLREVTSLGMTMNQLGTKPYAPPESGTLNPVPAYDVYSFAVMVLACLSGDFDMVDSGPEQVLGRVEVPEDVRSLLARCLADDPDDRPGSASVLLAELQQIEKQARPSEQVTEVGLEVTPAALRSFSDAMSAEASELADVVKELGPRVRVMLDAREAAGDDTASRPNGGSRRGRAQRPAGIPRHQARVETESLSDGASPQTVVESCTALVAHPDAPTGGGRVHRRSPSRCARTACRGLGQSCIEKRGARPLGARAQCQVRIGTGPREGHQVREFQSRRRTDLPVCRG